MWLSIEYSFCCLQGNTVAFLSLLLGTIQLKNDPYNNSQLFSPQHSEHLQLMNWFGSWLTLESYLFGSRASFFISSASVVSLYHLFMFYGLHISSQDSSVVVAKRGKWLLLREKMSLPHRAVKYWCLIDNDNAVPGMCSTFFMRSFSVKWKLHA